MAPYCFGLGHCCVSSNLHIQLRQFNIPFIMHMGGGNGSECVGDLLLYLRLKFGELGPFSFLFALIAKPLFHHAHQCG